MTKSFQLCLAVAIAGGALFGQTPAQTPSPKPAAAPPAAEATNPPVSLNDFSSSLENLVTRVRPSVVQIYSTGYATSEESDATTASLLSKQHSTGSGIIVADDGYIVTNAHVVKGARRIQVRLPSRSDLAGRNVTLQPEGKLVDAKLVGLDRDIDVAVVKIDKTGLPFLAFGDSNRIHQGELVMAFGSPLGLETSVSMGVVSSVARALHPDDMMVYIQTDAPINPGNSGGPLVDSQGRVIGINTFILTQSGGSEGLGFAIPASIVKSVYGQIRREGHVHRGRIGVHVQTITPGMASGLNLTQDWGVIIADVQPDGPSDKAGVQVGDIVRSLNGKLMHDARQLELEIFRSPMRQKVTMDVLRKSDHLTIEIPVIDAVDDPTRFADLVNPEDNLIPRLGILGIGIDKKLAAMLPDLRNSYGVVVAAGSATDLSSGTGLNPGDVIYSVNGTPVATVAALKSKLDEYKAGEPIVMQVERSGVLLFVTLELE
ncbi:MAG TPA: trypsin-like peptidase domain-containing protein [Bryobacteraceae bacterium]|nr:trypsin-like peptidase domain-containing protein [Bryobacteraceae bacterium]